MSEETPPEPVAAERGEIADARYVVKEIVRGEVLSGPALEETQPLVHQLVIALQAFETTRPLAPDAVAALQAAMAALMAAISPVTLQSLKDTQVAEDGAPQDFWHRLMSFSPRAAAAFRFSTRLVTFTVAVVILAVVCSVATDPTVSEILGPKLKVLLQLLLPYSYGAVGSCVYLLRSLHKHIYGRTFDRRRKPEYVNRVLLGMVSGGIIGLFLGSGKAGSADAAKISSAALGFLAGYNIDLLFSALERVTNAVFPKVEGPPPQAAPPVNTAPSPPAQAADSGVVATP